PAFRKMPGFFSETRTLEPQPSNSLDSKKRGCDNRTMPAATKHSKGSAIARRSVALLLAINLFNYIDRQVLAAVVPEIQQEFGASGGLAGLLATAFLVSYMVAAPLFGWLGDRYRRWALIGF